MKGRTLTKLMIDIVLAVLFIILIYPRETGFTFHEIAGLSIGAMFILHITLNWAWVKNVTRNLFNTRLNTRTKLNYLLNSISFIAVATVIITGVQISSVLFPTSGTVSHTTVLVHKWSSYTCLGLLGLHLALHWRFFVHTVPRALREGRPSWVKAAMSLGAVVLTLALLYSQISSIGAGTASQLVASYESHGDRDSRPRSGHDTGRHRQNRDSIPPGTGSSPSTSSAAPTNSPAASGSGGSSGSGQSSNKSTTGQSSKETSVSSSTSKPGASVSNDSGSSTTGAKVTLAQYLGSMFCTACEKRCPLLSPRCDRGVQQQEAAKQKYQAIYLSAASNQ